MYKREYSDLKADENNVWYRRAPHRTVMVFVHGILADSMSSWAHQSGNDQPVVYWPDLILKDSRIGPVDVFLGGYFTATDAGEHGISNCAEELFDGMRRADEHGNPPVLSYERIIFVCHSTGGIVARYLLESRREAFRDKTVGLVLIASPSDGSKLANFAGLLAKVYRNRLGRQLQWRNWDLGNLDARFKTLVHDPRRAFDLRGIEAYENRFIFHRKWWPDTIKVVEPESAGKYFGAPIHLPKTDHFSAAKPDSFSHPSHQLLVNFWADFQETRRSTPSDSEKPPEPAGAIASGCSAPAIPSIFLGRKSSLVHLTQWLVGSAQEGADGNRRSVIVLRGWPGIGKTAIAAALAHDSEITKRFVDGVFWISLGDTPNLLATLAALGKALGSSEILAAPTLGDAVNQLAALFNKRRALLIIDDVWEVEHGAIFKHLRGNECRLLFTTRLPKIAEALAAPEAIFIVPVLSAEDAFDLMRILAPAVAEQYPNEIRDLLADLEYLPLALHVAGHLLNKDAARGWDAGKLLKELRDGTKVLLEKAPDDRIEIENQTIPTVAVLLQKSVDRLDPRTRKCFAFLGPFAPKPATFDLDALRSSWEIADPRPVVDELVDRGLLEPVGSGRFQMHALLVSLARSLLV